MGKVRENNECRKDSCYLFNKRQILDYSNLKKFTEDNFKFDSNSGKFSKRVTCIRHCGKKRAIASRDQFLLYPHCAEATCPEIRKYKGVLEKWLKIQRRVWEWVKRLRV